MYFLLAVFDSYDRRITPVSFIRKAFFEQTPSTEKDEVLVESKWPTRPELQPVSIARTN